MPAYPAPPLSHSAGAPMSPEDGAPKPITPHRTAFAILFTMRPTSTRSLLPSSSRGLNPRSPFSLPLHFVCLFPQPPHNRKQSHQIPIHPIPRSRCAPSIAYTRMGGLERVRSGCFPTSHSSVPSFRAAPFQPIYHHSRGRGSTPNASTICRDRGHVSYLHVGPDRPIVLLRSLPSDPQTRLYPSHDSGPSHPHAPLLPLSCNCADSRLSSFSTVLSRR